MPFIGLSPFLHGGGYSRAEETPYCVNALYRAFSISTAGNEAGETIIAAMCQCPLSGFLHFYANQWVEDSTHACCVNALYRAFSISTGIIMKRLINKLLCQCPLSGFLHFYLHRIGGIYYEKYCVNALYRAFSISTLPSGNALKWSICRLDFAGNCLTTSKSAYFLLFLCLFTLCSYFFVIFRP